MAKINDPNHKKNIWKISAIVFAFFLGIILIYRLKSKTYPSISNIPIIVTPYPTKVQISTSDWKKFSDENLNLSFNYPSNWIVTKDERSEKIGICDFYDILPNKYPKPSVKFGICGTAETKVKPIGFITFSGILNIQPESLSEKVNQPIQLSSYENNEQLSVEHFNNKYLSEPVAGDPANIWAPHYEKVTNSQRVNAWYDKEHYCVARCQIFVWSQGKKIFILKNFPRNIENQDEIFRKVFESVWSSGPPPPTGTLIDIVEPENQWKIYTDEEWNFSIKYPSNYYFYPKNEASIGPVVTISNFDLKAFPNSNWSKQLRITIYREPVSSTLEEYVKKRPGKILSSRKININGIEGIQQEEEGYGKNLINYFLKDKFIYSVSFGLESIYKNIGETILSSFKFTK